MQSTIHKCDDKLLVEVPTELSAQLGWEVGDILSIEASENGLKVTRTMTAHDHAMKIARKGMEKYRDTFETLAKS